jgi:hypothetical protein
MLRGECEECKEEEGGQDIYIYMYVYVCVCVCICIYIYIYIYIYKKERESERKKAIRQIRKLRLNKAKWK